MRAWIAIVLSVAVGCGDKKKPDEHQPNPESPDPPRKKNEPDGTPRPQAKLDVKLDGKAVAMQQALAWKRPDGSIHFTVSSVPVSCGQVTGDMRMLFPNEVNFDVTEASQLQPDGSIKPVITQTYFSGMTHSEPKLATGTGDGTVGQPSTIDVDFELKNAAGDRAIAVKGTIDALGCEPPKVAKPVPMGSTEQASWLVIAGKRLQVGNAYVEPGDAPTLVLTTGKETCKHAAGEKQGEFVLRLTWFKKDDPTVSQIQLGGTMLPSAIDQTFDKKAISVNPGPPTKITQVLMSADIKVSGYPVKIEGNVVPDICQK
jgi:hypothetical protein